MTKEPADSNPKNDLNVKKSKKRDIKEVEEQPGKKEKLYGRNYWNVTIYRNTQTSKGSFCN